MRGKEINKTNVLFNYGINCDFTQLNIGIEILHCHVTIFALLATHVATLTFQVPTTHLRIYMESRYFPFRPTPTYVTSYIQTNETQQPTTLVTLLRWALGVTLSAASGFGDVQSVSCQEVFSYSMCYQKPRISGMEVMSSTTETSFEYAYAV